MGRTVLFVQRAEDRSFSGNKTEPVCGGRTGTPSINAGN